MENADGPGPEPLPISTREELVLALKDVAELEHLFICQYLYSAFSLKKSPDETCNSAQCEIVRRWASVIYMIARQEMEHLALVLGMLTAIGEPPHLGRRNMPILSPLFQKQALLKRHSPSGMTGEQCDLPDGKPCDLPFLLEPFSLRVARRYMCMEAPRYEQTHGDDREDVKNWCFADAAGQCNTVGPEAEGIDVYPLHSVEEAPQPEIDLPQAGAPAVKDIDKPIFTGDIERFYDRIRAGFVTLSAPGSKSLFKGNPAGQVPVLSEYNIFILPITDLDSTLAAIDLITEQGEGLKGPPGFDSHFRAFLEIAREFDKLQDAAKKANARFEPALPIPLDPSPHAIEHPLTLRIFDLFNQSYTTLLFMLRGLYEHFSANGEYAHFGPSLRETVFAPAMTMLIRPLAEVLVQLPLVAGGSECAGPSFDLAPNDLDLLTKHHETCFADITFYIERMELIIKELGSILEDEDFGGIDGAIQTRLGYIRDNAYRLAGNLRQIYQAGVYVKFRT